MHHVVDKIAKDAGMASFQCGVDENMVGSMFIHSHQHPVLDMLEKHGVPVFVVNICNICEVVDKKKVNKTYMEEQQKAYSQVKDRPNAVVETAFVHVPVSFMKQPKPWIIDWPRKDFEPDHVDNGTPVWALACILGFFDHCLLSSELALKGIWIISGISDVEECHKQPITGRAMNMVANPQFGADDNNDWGENDTLLLRLGQFPHESDDAF